MVLDNRRWETLAQRLAGDVPFRQASKQAGYGHRWKERALKRTKRADVVARVAEIRRAKALEAADLTPMIDALMAAAKDAQDMTEKTPATLTAIRGLLVEAARLKGLAPPPLPAQPAQPRRRMTDEEWMETFAPKLGAGA
jgi:hypothetical protein